MPTFTPGDVYTNVPLTQAAIKLFQSGEGFVARKAAPRMPVKKLSGTYYKWKQGDLNRNEMVVRGYNSPTPIAAFGKETAMFEINARSLGYNLNDWLKRASDVAIDPSQIIPQLLAYKASLSLELLFSAFAFADTTWFRVVTGVSSGAAPARTTATGTRIHFSDANTDPIKAIREERNDIELATGWKGDAIIFGADLFEAVAMHPLVRATLTNGSNPILRDAPANESEIARLCGVKWVGVASAIYNTALEGETATNSRIVPSDGMLLYRRFPAMQGEAASAVADDAGVFNPEAPCAMARAQWEEAVGNTEGFRLRSIRDEDAGPGGSQKTVCDSAHDFTLVNSKMGVLFKTMLP
jgi:hypothetical protein